MIDYESVYKDILLELKRLIFGVSKLNGEDMKDKIKHIAEHYGYDAQSHMLIEEMAELTQAINKYYRVRNEHGYPTDKTSEEVFTNLLEEIADVEICIEELKALLDCNAKVSAWKYTKIARQLKRMEKETS